MRHCGIDVHARTSELCEVSAKGKVVRRERMATSRAGLRRRFEGVPKTAGTVPRTSQKKSGVSSH